MKIGIYTDVHCSYTSSILPIHCDGTKYTTRLNMIINTFKWMYDKFNAENVDIIVNCGDLFDSHNLRSEEISAMSEALSYSKGIPEYHVLGNHEILDKRRNFYATALLSNYNNITVVDVPLKTDMGLSFLPYMEPEDVNNCLSMIKNDYLFSHIDIQGSRLNQFYTMDTGVETQKLKDLFKFVFNGHIHTYQNLGDNIYNVGATTSYSFSDDSSRMPGICVFDTDTKVLQRFGNPYAIRFMTVNCETDNEYNALKILLDDSTSNFLALKVRCELSLKESVMKLLDSYDNIVTYRIQTNAVVKSFQTIEDTTSSTLEDSSSVYDKFIDFIDNHAELKFGKEYYHKVADTYLRSDLS